MRLKSEIWVKAYLRRCVSRGAMGVVLRHGDDDAGAIHIKVVRGDRMAQVFQPAPAGFEVVAEDRRWVVSFKGEFVSEDDAQRLLDREAEFDSDAWIIEIEDRDGRNFLDDDVID